MGGGGGKRGGGGGEGGGGGGGGWRVGEWVLKTSYECANRRKKAFEALKAFPIFSGA